MNDNLKRALVLKGLSLRQADVAMLVATGLPNKAVALELHVCEKTVSYHMTDIFKRLKRHSPEVMTRTRLMAYVNTLLASPTDGRY